MITSAALLLDVHEVAARLSVSRATAENLIYTGELRSVKVRRCRRVAVEDLEGYIQQLRIEDDRQAGALSIVKDGGRRAGRRPRSG